METDTGQAMAVANGLTRHAGYAKHAGGEADLAMVEASVLRRLCRCLGERRAWWRTGEEGERVWIEAVSQLSRVSSNGAGERMGMRRG